MRIYIDEDMVAGIVVRLLRNAGHDVETPAGIGMLGRSDAAQLTKRKRVGDWKPDA